MKRVEKEVARLRAAAHNISKKKGPFLSLFVLVFCVSILVLARLDLLPGRATAPEARSSTSPVVPDPASGKLTQEPEVPLEIVIPQIKLSASVSNPSTTDIGVLDAALLSGAVRYPTSAKLGEGGNVVIFGHSSYLPIVNNPAYKTFDGIQKLKEGDRIIVSSSDRAYTYAVREVKKASAEDATILLSVSGRVLTLSTCDSFGTKSDRFVVTADFVASEALPI